MYIIQRFFWNNLNNELVNKLYYRIRNGYCINSEKNILYFQEDILIQILILIVYRLNIYLKIR